MALNKKSEEIRKTLEATKTQINMLEECARKVENNLNLASGATKKLQDRTRIMKDKMKGITTIGAEESDKILGIDYEDELDDSVI